MGVPVVLDDLFVAGFGAVHLMLLGKRRFRSSVGCGRRSHRSFDRGRTFFDERLGYVWVSSVEHRKVKDEERNG
jgi:hypothetical protein